MDFADIQIESKELTDAGEFSGYASVFGARDNGNDIVMKGAFTKSLQSGRKVRLLSQHDPRKPIGALTSLKEDDHGLAFEAKLSLGTTLGRETHELMKDGALDSVSIGYKTIDYEIQKKDGGRVRLLKEVDLWEVSVVTFPMLESALVTDVKQLQSEREVERILRDAGVPGAFAKLVSIYGYEEAKSRINSHREDGGKAAKPEDLKDLFNEIRSLKEKLNG